ncbi:MAG: FhaA domain-containing protein [Dermatophilaceae bacterium]
MGLFDRLEAGIERAVQGTFAKHLKSAVHPVEIASHVRRAMDDRAVSSGGRAIVPNVFTIELSSSDFDRLAPDLESIEMDLVAAAEEHCEGQRYQPAGPIDIVFEEHEDLETGVFRLRPSKASRPRATGMTGQNRALPERSGGGRSRNTPDAAPPTPGAPPLAGTASSHPEGGTSHPEGGASESADDSEATRAHPVPERPAPPRRARVNPADRPWLDVDGERYPLMSALTILGRDDSADIILDDPGISRRHSELRVTTDGPHTIATIRDLGSTNGTFVSGERITSERLEDGDRITVGRTSITYRAGRR